MLLRLVMQAGSHTTLCAIACWITVLDIRKLPLLCLQFLWMSFAERLLNCRGFAHIGILKALEEYGISFDMVGGTSIGAFIGGLYSEDQDVDKLRKRVRPWSKVGQG